MAQPSVSTFFITRKRGIEDDVITNKKKVICLERTHNSTESSDAQSDSGELGTVVVFPKAGEDQLSGSDDHKKTSSKLSMRQGITAQRVTRSRKVHMQEVDGIETPKMVNFWKGGNLSPQKKASKTAAIEVPKKVNLEPTKSKPIEAVKQQGMVTPKKATQVVDSIERTSIVSGNRMKLDEIKKKLKGSGRLADLKTSINQLQGGLDKLDQMEKKRLEGDALREEKRKIAGDPPKSLKPFKKIELEIMR